MNSHPQSQPEVGFRTFEDLEVYQRAREFRKEMYAVARRLPEFEKFALANQIRSAAVSLTNNLAEGHGRHHYLDQLQFVLHSRGSLEELIDDLNVCLDEKYLPAVEIESMRTSAWRVLHLINGYARYLRNRKANTTPVLHDHFMESDPLDDALF